MNEIKSPLELINEIEEHIRLHKEHFTSNCSNACTMIKIYKAEGKAIKQMCEWMLNKDEFDFGIGLERDLTEAIEKAKEILK